MSASTAAAYKARKEAFVSNLSGSSLTDINLVTLVAPVGQSSPTSPSFYTNSQGCRSIMDCSSEASIFVHTSNACGFDRRFPSQCLRHFIRLHTILIGSNSTQYLVGCPRCLSITPVITCREVIDIATDQQERCSKRI